ncbi:iron ABC transporter permease [Paenibacillus sp. FSL H8-0548]|uniref:FecCD family ABC transporter permease n=1 Tax=Paenibacillus sp. FSL H8-0548 TaxID=1920422 RepID=UPI00096FE1AA|nr:iron ABC transporter permease [Paenibacillus sp. FSL H8-0548]OMF23241.1 iron ABC transporter permease [Paenibacillus sp. FSL H8-0548]
MNHHLLSNSEARKRKRAIQAMVILGLLILISFFISMNTGYTRLPPLDLLKVIFGFGGDEQNLILFEFRLPRIVISVLIGAGLAVAGCVMQGISRNALADPGILGINAGAGLMVMLFISFYPTTNAAPVALLPLLAFVGGSLIAALIYGLAYKRSEGLIPIRLLMSGIAVSAAVSSAMIVLTIRLSPQKFRFVATWLAGSIWGADWTFVLSLLPWIVVLLPFVFFKARTMNVLNLGDQLATGLGTSVTREQTILLAAAVGLSASCVAVSGGIGFVGLIAPHLGRRLVGSTHQFLLPTSALIGSLLVIIADTIGRWIVQPLEIPTGIVIAVIGAPYFLYLLSRTKV